MSTNSSKSDLPLGSLSLDLDNKWSYLKTHGDSNWESFPSYFNVAVPRFLDFFEKLNLKSTVFVVGQDCELEGNQIWLREIADLGHEIGNHSFHHEPWLHLYTPKQLENEFSRSEKVIFNATGKKPVGFRGPGFSLSNEVLSTLIRRGYEYDCSTFPTYLGPVARAYYFMKSNFSKAEKEDRKELFGRASDGFQSNNGYNWRANDRKLLEIPVTTFPIFKLPIHASYLLYLGKFSPALAKTYFWKAMVACRLMGVEPSFLLHPLDFLGEEDEPDLAFFPGMDQPAEKKIRLLESCLSSMTKRFNVVTMKEHADSLKLRSLKERAIEKAPLGISGELSEASPSLNS